MKFERLTQTDVQLLSEANAFNRVDFDEEDEITVRMVQAAVQEIEHLAQIAMLTSAIKVTLDDWSDLQPVRLPIGPVQDSATATVQMIDGGVASTLSSEYYWLESGKAPRLHLLNTSDLPAAFSTSLITIEYDAGYGASASDIPDDLVQAVLSQVSLMFDGRGLDKLTVASEALHVAAKYRGVGI